AGRRPLVGVHVLRSDGAAGLLRHLQHPVADRRGAPPRARLRVPGLLDLPEPQDELQEPVPPHRGPLARRVETARVMLYTLARTALFKLDPEVAHDLTLKSLSLLGPGAALLGAGADAGEARRVMGIDFPNAVGLAAGLDKNGEYIDALGALGFGFLEVGTVTPRPQPGNPKPRLFRLPEHEAIINRMGFNNHGVEKLVRNVERASFHGVLGINIGKNFDTPIERAADDYLACMDAVYERATYVAVNVSSPNTKNLRDLQSPERLDELLGALMARRDALAERHLKTKPLALKVAPDLDDE